MTMRWAWLVVCVGLLATVASAGPAPPPPSNPEIVYVDGTKIVVMNRDGSNKTVVYTAGSGRSVFTPDISPDAQWMVFKETPATIRRVERVSGATTVLMTPAECIDTCGNPSIAPSGTRVAVPGGGSTAPPVVWSVPSGGGTPVALYTGASGSLFRDVAWRSDEAQIAIIEFGGGLPNRIVVVDLGAQPPTSRTIVTLPANTTDAAVDWARGGVNRLVYDVVQSTSTTGAIYRVDFTDTSVSAPVLITSSGRWASFSPDNGSIVYERAASGRKRPIARLTLATGASVDLASDGRMPSWKR